MVELSDHDAKWLAKQEELTEAGTQLVMEASNEALEYIGDALDNMKDLQWRKMVIQSQAIEMGIGVALADSLVPHIYEDMRKKLHKKVKVDKDIADALRHIYIGRVVRNIRKALNERDR